MIASDRVGGARVCAVTGSSGKTSTKELLAGACSALGGSHAAVASYNNHWGVPLTLARLPESAAWAICEIGMNRAGEIRALTKLVRPHAAVVTNIGVAHLEHLGSRQGIADAKAEIFEGLEPRGKAILPRGDDFFDRLSAAAREQGAEVVSFGAHPSSDVRLLDYRAREEGSEVVASFQGQALTFQVPFAGRHQANNALAALAAVALAPPGRRGRAVGTVMLGLPIAMVAGVPLGTWAGQALGWQVPYWAVAAIGLLTALLVRLWVPVFPAERTASWRTEVRAFGSLQFWLTMLIGAVGFGGMFAMYSYIAPTVEVVTGMDRSWIPVFLFVYGAFSIVGTWLGGRLGDWSVLRTLLLMGLLSTASLLTFWQTSRWLVPALATLAVVAVSGSSWVIALQLRLMTVAGPAKTLGAAMNHSSLNIANALGAYVGGLVIAAGYGLRAPSLVGAALSLGGLVVLGVSLLVHRRERRRTPTTPPTPPPPPWTALSAAHETARD